jgi:hypothetical protein
MKITKNSKPSDQFHIIRKLGIVILTILIVSFYILSLQFLSR